MQNPVSFSFPVYDALPGRRSAASMGNCYMKMLPPRAPKIERGLRFGFRFV